jgi:hypothetical protein
MTPSLAPFFGVGRFGATDNYVVYYAPIEDSAGEVSEDAG